MHWGRTALCSFAVVAVALLGSVPAAATGPSGGARAAAARAPANAPALTLVSQSPVVTPTQPWFNVSLGIGAIPTSADGLHVSMTFYSRIDNGSQLQDAISGTFGGTVLERDTDIAVTSSGGALTASSCLTVLPDASATAPSSGAGACASGAQSVVLGCRPLTGTCGDVYPVSVALFRQGSTTPVSRFTTFLTYQEPGAIGEGGPLQVGVVLPVAAPAAPAVAAALTAHRDVAATLAIDPSGVAQAEAASKSEVRALQQLGSLDDDQLLDQPYVPVDLAALSEAGIAGEIGAQMARGQAVLRAAGLRTTGGVWVDTTTPFDQGDSGDMATGLQQAGASELVLSDGDLTTSGLGNYTFAQPFTLDLGHGTNVTAAAANSALSARFSSDPGNPALAAEQLLAGLSFVHFEDAFLSDTRGVVIEPPSGWRPSTAFLDALMTGLSDNPALSAVTLNQYFAKVPPGGGPGDREPTARHLQSGSETRGISRAAAVKIAQARQQLSSYTEAVAGHPSELLTLSDQLLATESSSLGSERRTAALSDYEKDFTSQTEKISLATEQTVTFTAQQASIPITVLSSAPYPVNVTVTLTSDKFVFPNGDSHHLLLDRPTTSWRFTARARTSGDRLPIDVTLHTQNGQLLLAHTVLTVHSTAISFVGVALTILAGAVLLFWWARTWRRSRRQRLRAH
jgi:Family of unknown function (DUF6049)